MSAFELRPLGQLLVGIETGKSFKTLERSAGPNELGVLKVSALSWGAFDPTEAKVVETDYEPEFHHRVRAGDLLLSRANTLELVGAAVTVNEDHPNRLLSDKTLRLQLDSSQADANYLCFALRSTVARSHLEANASGTSSSMRNVSQATILSTPIPWVSIRSQHTIATGLRVRFAAKESLLTALNRTQQDVRVLALAVLEEAFAPLAHVDQLAIATTARTGSGTTPDRGQDEFWGRGTIPWVKTGEIVFSPISEVEEYVTEVALRRTSLQLLPPGTVLVAMYGQGKTRGQSAVLKIEATCNQACFAIWPNDTWRPEFLQLWLQRNYRELRALSESRGGNQSNLNGALLKAFKAPVIPLAEQDRFVERVQAQLAELKQAQAALQAQRRDLDLLPSRLLAEAFA